MMNERVSECGREGSERGPRSNGGSESAVRRGIGRDAAVGEVRWAGLEGGKWDEEIEFRNL